MNIDITRLSSAFADEARMRIVLLLWEAHLCVKCLVASMDSPQPTVSRHLASLRNAGVVETRRDGNHVYYALNFSEPMGDLKKKLVTAYHDDLKEVEPFAGDYKRLMQLAALCEADCEVPFVVKKVS